MYLDDEKLEIENFKKHFPVYECDSCGEVHKINDMHIGYVEGAGVVSVRCEKCANPVNVYNGRRTSLEKIFGDALYK